MPDSVEMPAPVKATTLRASAIIRFSSSTFVIAGSSRAGLHRHKQACLLPGLDEAALAHKLGGRAHRLGGVVGDPHRGAAIGRHDLAYDREWIEAPVGTEPAEVVGKQRAPAVAEPNTAMEVAVDAL